MTAKKGILCLDFDGVIHSYTSGWKGVDQIPDPPVEGALEFIQQALKHFRVCIYSARSKEAWGRVAMREWLEKEYKKQGISVADLTYLMDRIEWPTAKPPALVTIDDRALCFTGVFPSIETLQNFKPWYL